MALSKTPIYFGSYLVTPQVFHITTHSFAIVNLKPLLPGHVLVSPRRCSPRLNELTSEEVIDLFLTVQRVGKVIERVFGGSSLNIAIQDGPAAGQSVPHLHTHIIPRTQDDLKHEGGSDAIYRMLDGDEGDIVKQFAENSSRPKFPPVDDASRIPRSHSEMVREARMLTEAMEQA